MLRWKSSKDAYGKPTKQDAFVVVSDDGTQELLRVDTVKIHGGSDIMVTVNKKFFRLCRVDVKEASFTAHVAADAEPDY